MEMNVHACIQRKAERDSIANEAERGNFILGRAATLSRMSTIGWRNWRAIWKTDRLVLKRSRVLHFPWEMSC